MEIDETFGLLLTWTCYGTWLPGDSRGHTSNILLPPGGFLPRQNVLGAPKAPADSFNSDSARRLQKGGTIYLDQTTATWAAMGMIEAAQKRDWRIIEATIMANHLHCVIVGCPNDGPAVRRILKGNSQALMCDRLGRNIRIWTAGGSDRYLNGSTSIEAAVQYAKNQNGILVEIVDMKII